MAEFHKVRAGRACSPPCSPQMPNLMPGRVLLPFAAAISMSWPTPVWSIEANGRWSSAKTDFVFGVSAEERTKVREN